MMKLDPAFMNALRWRCIGPPRGGRVVAVAGHPADPMTFYFGAVAGGVWKTTDGGTYWENISDGYFTSSSIGALAVSEADPNVLYAGTGETTIRIDVSYGDGVYKTTDGGKTWKHAGLKETRHIGRIRVHPKNPDVVYVAALGHAFGPNEDRGVFRSTDGGKTWEKVLYRSDRAGAVDLALDPNNPRILFAALWQTHRHFWELSSGGPDSGLYRSTDGGDTWEELTEARGLPAGLKGKIGVTVSPAKPGRVWALIEQEKPGLYRSDDGGDTWAQVNDNRDLMQRPWYYTHVFADTRDPDTVYITNMKMWKSTDAGRTFTEISTPHGDNHDLWIDPANPLRMIEGNDGGACVTFNGGATWSTIYNQLTAQFYRVDADRRFPYHVYGTQQDNTSIAVPSATEKGGITWQDCFPAGTGESGDIAVHPLDPDILFVGAIGSSPGGGGILQRYDHRTKQIRLVTVWPEVVSGQGAGEHKYRFSWTFPIAFSPHDPTVLYAAGNRVFRSTDEGGSWEPVSPDLSRADASKLGPSGGPITRDATGAETYATVYAFAESPHARGELWAGTDDGLVHVSRDNGTTWTDVTPPQLPEWALIHKVEVSPHTPGKVYVAATRYKLDDYRPYLYRTADWGRTWQTLSDGFPQEEITRVLCEDPARPGLLYAGTETGVYVSLDDGDSWQRLEGSLPVAPVYDMLVKDNDLVAATHGRSFWILDDLTPLREAASAALQAPAHLFPPAPAYRRWMNWTESWYHGVGRQYSISFGGQAAYFSDLTPEGERVVRMLDAGENPPRGAVIYYLLNETENVSLTILDAAGSEIRTFLPKPADAPAPPATGEPPKKKERYIPVKKGLNRFVWDMRHPDAVKIEGDEEAGPNGMLAVPGRYQVRLSAAGHALTQSFEIRPDPRVAATPAAFEVQFALWQRIRDRISDANAAVDRLRRIRRQAGEWKQRASEQTGIEQREAILSAVEGLTEKLTGIEKAILQTEGKPGLCRTHQIRDKLVVLVEDVASADAPPTKQMGDVFDHLSARLEEQLKALEAVIAEEVAELNASIRNAGLDPVGTA
jgi:photosystem II stability/assembly factor-like uncharacterized protein